MTFGKTLRRCREQAKKTMGELARELAVSPAYLSDVERGRRPPLVEERLKRAARFLSVEPETLIAAAAAERGTIRLNTDRGEQLEAGVALMRTWDNLTPEQYREIIEIVGRSPNGGDDQDD
ncbi:MAG: helix-turn-helix transcriptional regulator [Planctomycetes bacterium]|nr:helix-turn-helix transcriptional regulator [Planctomycetota bacterium]